MSRKTRVLCYLLVFMLTIHICSLADIHRSVFDEFSEGLETIANVDPSYNESRSLKELFSSNNGPFETAVKMWYNLLEQELRQGKELSETMAAEIYRGFKEGHAVCAIGTLSTDAVNLNILYGIYNEKACDTVVLFWLEWNTEKRVLQAARLVTEDMDIYSDLDIQYSGEYNYWSMLAKRDPALTGPDRSVGYIYDTKSKFVESMNNCYAKENNGKKPQIN